MNTQQKSKNSNADLRTYHLPYKASVIAKIIGINATLDLAKECKHRCLYVPRSKLPENHPIISIIGQNLAKKLQHEFCGELIGIPTCRYVHKRQRNTAIQTAYADGKSIRELAEIFNVSRRTIGLIIHPDRARRHRQRVREQKRLYDRSRREQKVRKELELYS